MVEIIERPKLWWFCTFGKWTDDGYFFSFGKKGDSWIYSFGGDGGMSNVQIDFYFVRAW